MSKLPEVLTARKTDTDWRQVYGEAFRDDPIIGLQVEMEKYMVVIALMDSLTREDGESDGNLKFNIVQADERVDQKSHPLLAVRDGLTHLGDLIDRHFPTHPTKITLRGDSSRAGFIDSSISSAHLISEEVAGIILFGLRWGKVYEMFGEQIAVVQNSIRDNVIAAKFGLVWANLVLGQLRGAVRFEEEITVTEEAYALETRRIGRLMQDVSAALVQAHTRDNNHR